MKLNVLTRGLPCACLIGLLITAAVSCKKDLRTSSSAGVTTTPRATSYQLVWDDEFNGTGVNTSNWNLDVGNPGVNSEQEYYQASNATVSNGNLVITAAHQTVGGQPYTSAKLETAGKFSITYGRIEARIALPAIGDRPTRHPGYAVSGRVRKRIEEVFGWTKAAAGFRKTHHRGLARVGWMFTLTATAYDLVRLPKLVGMVA